MTARRGVDDWVRRWWRGDAGWWGRMATIALLPGEWLFRWGAGMRNRLFDAGLLPTGHAGVPVVSVGNLTVGGTGKTPLVGWFVSALSEAGARPAVVSRGYGRDEVLLHRRWHPEVAVLADVDRVAAASRAAEAGAEVVVLDDGFQHRALARDLDVVLVAAETAFPGRRLPRGPYREGPRALRRSQVVVVTRKTASAAQSAAVAREIQSRHRHLTVGRVCLRPGGWTTLDGAPAEAPGGDALVLTAVAEPESVLALAERASGEGSRNAYALSAFPDHHEFTDADLREAVRAGRRLIVTEKDAMKLRERRDTLGDLPVHVLTLVVDWEAGEDEVRTLLTDLVGRAGGSP